MEFLEEPEVLKKQSEHYNVLAPFVKSFRKWRNLGKKHPVYDFLFTYYSFSGGELLRWTPGLNYSLESIPKNCAWNNFYEKKDKGYNIDPKKFAEHRKPYLDWAIKYLTCTRDRQAVFHCFGLHEWAMVYESKTRHHPQENLRLSNDEIRDVVDSHSLCCTHYDAYRFFTPSSKPKNLYLLERSKVSEFDQKGCIHVNMDLYRFSYKIAPFISSDAMKEAFLLSKHAREIDMRASPYDLSNYGLTPIFIETEDGKKEYVKLQQDLSKNATSIRDKLIREYQELRELVFS